VAMFLYNQQHGKKNPRILSIFERWYRDRRIPREALIDPQASPWEHLYVSKNDQALITLCGFDHHSFRELEIMFEPYFHNYSPWNTSDGILKRIDSYKTKGGRPRKINARSCLALSLAFFRFRGPLYILQGWFGLTGTNLCGWLEFSRLIIVHVLQNNKSKIQFPNEEKIQVYKDIIRRRHPLLKNCYCVADGLKLYLQKSGDIRIQSRFYNGWTHSHYVTNLFVFSPDGMIIACVLNAPGSIHDSTLAEWGNIYEVLERTYEKTGGQCCMDSAFASMNSQSIIRSAQDHSTARNPEELLVFGEATSLRQAAEWGMRAIQGSFPRIKDPLRYEELGGRKLVLMCMVMLYNYRCDRVGLNQIRTVYVPEWNKNIEDLDKY
jgi:hypothetical protein